MLASLLCLKLKIAMNKLDLRRRGCFVGVTHQCRRYSFGFQIHAGASRSPIPESPPAFLAWRRTLPSGPFSE